MTVLSFPGRLSSLLAVLLWNPGRIWGDDMCDFGLLYSAGGFPPSTTPASVPEIHSPRALQTPARDPSTTPLCWLS